MVLPGGAAWRAAWMDSPGWTTNSAAPAGARPNSDATRAPGAEPTTVASATPLSPAADARTADRGGQRLPPATSGGDRAEEHLLGHRGDDPALEVADDAP